MQAEMKGDFSICSINICSPKEIDGEIDYAEFLEFDVLSPKNNDLLKLKFFETCIELTEKGNSIEAYNQLASMAQFNKYALIQNSANIYKKYEFIEGETKEEFLAKFADSIKVNADYDKYINKVINTDKNSPKPKGLNTEQDVVNGLGLFAYALTKSIQDLSDNKEFMDEYNILRESAVYDGNKKIDKIAQFINSCGCDIIALQEANESAFKKIYAKVYDYEGHYAHCGGFLVRRGKFDIAVLLKMCNGIELANVNDETQYLMIESGEKAFIIVNTHLTSCGKDSEKVEGVNYESQAETLFATIRDVSKGTSTEYLNIIAIGDYNHTPKCDYLTVASPRSPTTCKKRSFFQTQARKAGVIAEGIRTHAVHTENVKIVDINVIKFDLKPFNKITDGMLPNPTTPIDHLPTIFQVQYCGK